MSLLAKLFGGKKEGPPPSPQEAIQRLRDIEEMLNKKSDFLENKINSEVATARKHGTKNKRMALHALKRKKQYEKQLLQIDGTLSTIEFQREALENASTNTEVLSAMGNAAKALKSAHNNMDVDKVHDLMDDIAEQQDVANEISEAISNPIGFGQAYDEDDLMAELEELEQEELDSKMLNVGPVSDQLPETPSGEPATAATSKPTPQKRQAVAEDDDLSELEQWAAA